jgi:hypothetical protein
MNRSANRFGGQRFNSLPIEKESEISANASIPRVKLDFQNL